MKSFTVLRSEKQDDFDAVLAALCAEMQPATEHERFLVEQMAAARWRLSRLHQMETALFDALINPEAPRSPQDQFAHKFGNGADKNLTTLNRLIAGAERSYYKAHAELTRARQSRREAQTVETLDTAVLARMAKAPHTPPAARTAAAAAEPAFAQPALAAASGAAAVRTATATSGKPRPPFMIPSRNRCKW